MPLTDGAIRNAKSRRTLRPYQQDAVAKFREGLTDTGRAQVILATGLGKTVVMAEVVADLYRDGLISGNRVLVLADKRELIRQLQFGFWHQLPEWVPTHMLSSDEIPTFNDGITFATVQSIIGRLDELPSYGLVLVDEAHNIGSASFRRALDALSPPMVGGATATPFHTSTSPILIRHVISLENHSSTRSPTALYPSWAIWSATPLIAAPTAQPVPTVARS